MKKLLFGILAILMLGTVVYALPFTKKDNTLVTVPLFSTESNAENTVWAATFQLVWNDLMNDIVKGDVYIQGGNDEVVNGLNMQFFKSDMISPVSYYKIHGVMNTTLRDTINTALKEKFNETSDLLQGLDWSGNNYLLYAMLKKDFKYPFNFDELEPAKFGNSTEKVKYFGISDDSDDGLRITVDVLFHESKKKHAVILHTENDDIVMLYRTNDNLTLAAAYKQMLDKSFEFDGNKSFGPKDTLKVPFVKFKNDYQYANLTNKKVYGTDFTIGSAMQTIDFNMDNTGVKLKSAASMIMRTALPAPDTSEKREFEYDDNFYIFMQEGLNQPYFAMKIGDITGIK